MIISEASLQKKKIYPPPGTMEAVPRLPMISFEQKISPENVDFASKLKQLIASVGEVAAFFEEIKELKTLR